MKLSEKDQRKTFNRCFNRLKSNLSFQPYAITKLFEPLKRKRDEIVAKVTLPESMHHKEVTEYEKDMYSALLEEFHSMILDGPVKDATEYKKLLNSVIEKLYEFSDEISSGKIDISKAIIDQKPEHWQGADVFITSDFSSEVPSRYGIVVRTVNAKQITWLMGQLRDRCKDYIDYMNRYEFFGTIAENAKDFIENYGDKESHCKRLLTYLLDQQIPLISKKVSETDSFIRGSDWSYRLEYQKWY